MNLCYSSVFNTSVFSTITKQAVFKHIVSIRFLAAFIKMPPMKRKTTTHSGQGKITKFFRSENVKRLYDKKLFNDINVMGGSDSICNTDSLDCVPVASLQPAEHIPRSEKPPPDPKTNKLQETNKKLVKLALHQASTIDKLQTKIANNDSNSEQNYGLNKEQALSDEHKFKLKNVPVDKKYDAKFIRTWLNILYADNLHNLNSRSLTGTKERYRKIKLDVTKKLHAPKKPISPEKFNVIQEYFRIRVRNDTDEQRKTDRHFRYCFNEAVKQASKANDKTKIAWEDELGIHMEVIIETENENDN